MVLQTNNGADVASKYLGKHEVTHNKFLKKLLGFNPAKTAWCAGFVNTIEQKCGRQGTGKLLARSYLKYGERIISPGYGDIVVLKRGWSSWQGHVGYFVGETPTHVKVLGGNQDNQVSIKLYPKKKVLGYRRP